MVRYTVCESVTIQKHYQLLLRLLLSALKFNATSIKCLFQVKASTKWLHTNVRTEILPYLTLKGNFIKPQPKIIYCIPRGDAKLILIQVVHGTSQVHIAMAQFKITLTLCTFNQAEINEAIVFSHIRGLKIKVWFCSENSVVFYTSGIPNGAKTYIKLMQLSP